MAGTIQMTVQALITNGLYKETFQPGSLTVTQTNQGAHGQVVSVGSGAEEDMPIGDIGTEGLLFLHNLDDTNFVTYGPKSGTMVAMGIIKAGEVVALRMDPAATITWQADTAAVKIKMLLLED